MVEFGVVCVYLESKYQPMTIFESKFLTFLEENKIK